MLVIPENFFRVFAPMNIFQAHSPGFVALPRNESQRRLLFDAYTKRSATKVANTWRKLVGVRTLGRCGYLYIHIVFYDVFYYVFVFVKFWCVLYSCIFIDISICIFMYPFIFNDIFICIYIYL